MRPVLFSVAITLALLSGCSTLKAPAPVRADPVDDRAANIDERLLESCPTLGKLLSGRDEDNLKFVEQLLNNYVSCYLKQESLANVVRKALNVKAK